ncbi:MAG: SOS response-associated peptidase [Novosphingobium meiothermophilum]
MLGLMWVAIALSGAYLVVMCNLYRMTGRVQAIARMFAPLGKAPDDLPAFSEIWPGSTAPVLIARGGQYRLGPMQWGWPPPVAGQRPVINVRNLQSPMWRAALEDPARRCVVPVTAFCEWSASIDPQTRRKRPHWFALKDQPLFAFAGLWRQTADGPRFAFLTCPANALVGRVHPKAMPVILASGEAAMAWLTADAERAEAMQRPFAEAAMIEIADERQAAPPAQPRLL